MIYNDADVFRIILHHSLLWEGSAIHLIPGSPLAMIKNYEIAMKN